MLYLWFMTKVIKAVTAGAVGSLVMFVLTQLALLFHLVPFEVSPSAAFVIRIGLDVQPAAILIHLVYGVFWSVVLVASVEDRVKMYQGLTLGLGLWLLMMLVIGPLIGWGFFGFGASENPTLPQLALGDPLGYSVATLILHLVYGLAVGIMNATWIEWPRRFETTEASAGAGT